MSEENEQVPPIPEHCPQFVRASGQWVFSAVGCFPKDRKDWQNGGWPWPLSRAQEYQRPIIGAVAEVAWLSEAERAFERAAECDGRSGGKAHYDVWMACRRNAERWRNWSKETP